MKDFKQLRSNLLEFALRADGLFVRATPTTKSMLILQDRFPFKLQKDLHCTIIFSKQPVTITDSQLSSQIKSAPISATSKKITWWAGHDAAGYLVLELISSDLQVWHDRFKNLGVIPTFPEYKPHVTLVTPCEENLHSVDDLNKQVLQNPLELEFYYAGMAPVDKK